MPVQAQEHVKGPEAPGRCPPRRAEGQVGTNQQGSLCQPCSGAHGPSAGGTPRPVHVSLAGRWLHAHMPGISASQLQPSRPSGDVPDKLGVRQGPRSVLDCSYDGGRVRPFLRYLSHPGSLMATGWTSSRGPPHPEALPRAGLQATAWLPRQPPASCLRAPARLPAAA